MKLRKYLAESDVADQAKKLGLMFAGWGKWQNAQGKITHETIDGKLVKISKEDKKPDLEKGKLYLQATKMGLHHVPGQEGKFMNHAGSITHEIKNGKLEKIEKKEKEDKNIKGVNVKFRYAKYNDRTKNWEPEDKWEEGTLFKYSRVDNRIFDKTKNRVKNVYDWKEI